LAERTLSRARAGDKQAFRELIDRTGESSSCNEAVSLAFVAASSSCRRDTGRCSCCATYSVSLFAAFGAQVVQSAVVGKR
jgi:hypothetical protein